jgi:hypothetical protein
MKHLDGGRTSAGRHEALRRAARFRESFPFWDTRHGIQARTTGAAKHHALKVNLQGIQHTPQPEMIVAYTNTRSALSFSLLTQAGLLLFRNLFPLMGEGTIILLLLILRPHRLRLASDGTTGGCSRGHPRTFSVER